MLSGKNMCSFAQHHGLLQPLTSASGVEPVLAYPTSCNTHKATNCHWHLVKVAYFTPPNAGMSKGASFVKQMHSQTSICRSFSLRAAVLFPFPLSLLYLFRRRHGWHAACIWLQLRGDERHICAHRSSCAWAPKENPTAETRKS